ncbi:hypothetical protein COCSUDRAFT_34622, partial [Coccomyxa subellipsoidea C-169]
DRCIVFQSYTGGFMANVHNVILAVAFVARPGNILYFDDSEHSYHCPSDTGVENHSWDVFFNGSQPTRFPTSEHVLKNCSKVNTMELLQMREELAVQAGCSSADDLSFREGEPSVRLLYAKLADATEKVWKFSSKMQYIVDYEVESIRLMAGKQLTIGIQARGGDKMSEQGDWANKITSKGHSRAFDQVKKHLPPDVHGKVVCIIVGDDYNLANSLARLATATFDCLIINRVMPSPRSISHDQGIYNSSPLQERCHGTFRILADVEMLANTNFFVGYRNSNVATMVSLIRRFIYKKNKGSEFDFSESSLKPY